MHRRHTVVRSCVGPSVPRFQESVPRGCLDSVEWNGGMEYWNGIVERWNEHAHDSIDKNVMCS